MKLQIEMKLDSAAFDAGGCGSEVARILRELARRFDHIHKQEMGDISLPVVDVNGNIVGRAGAK